MENVTYTAYVESLLNSGVDLHERIIDVGTVDYATECHTTTLWHAAIVNAAEVIRTHPSQKLASRPIEAPLITDQALDFEAKILQGIVNASIEWPQAAASINIFNGMGRRLDACSLVESRFSTMLGVMATLLPNRAPMYGWTLFVDDINKSDEVIAIQKHGEIRNALTLAPLSISGIPFPAGSIMNIDLGEAARPARKERSVVGVSRVVSAAFLRLSAFSGPAERQQRDVGYLNDMGIETSYASIEQIKKIANSAKAISSRI